jgi:hypothetical protein
VGSVDFHMLVSLLAGSIPEIRAISRLAFPIESCARSWPARLLSLADDSRSEWARTAPDSLKLWTFRLRPVTLRVAVI